MLLVTLFNKLNAIQYNATLA